MMYENCTVADIPKPMQGYDLSYCQPEDMTVREQANEMAWHLMREEDKPERDKGFALLRLSDEMGYAPATYALALCYYKGEFVKKDYKKSIEKMIKASTAERPHPGSLLEMARLYREGSGTFKIEKDLVKSIDAYKKMTRVENVHEMVEYVDALQEAYDEFKDNKYIADAFRSVIKSMKWNAKDESVTSLLASLQKKYGNPMRFYN